MHVVCCVCSSVFLSVCPSDISRCCAKSSKRSITETVRYSLQSLLTSRCYSNGVSLTGASNTAYRWGRLKSAIFDQYLVISQKCCKCCQLISSTDDRRQFVTVNVHLCLPHKGLTHIVARFVCDSCKQPYRREQWNANNVTYFSR